MGKVAGIFMEVNGRGFGGLMPPDAVSEGEKGLPPSRRVRIGTFPERGTEGHDDPRRLFTPT
ncbi:MAG: hypothetical protein Fur0034_15140 [Desulfuromonadia bacterium]